MQLSGTSGEGIYTDVDFLLGGTTNTNYTANDKARNVNRWYQKAFAVVLRSMAEWGFQEASATATLSATVQNYLFPTDILEIERVELMIDGTNWYRATPLDRNQIDSSIQLSADINKQFSITAPYYDVRDVGASGIIDFYPVPYSAVTGGAKFYYHNKLTYLSASGDVPVIAEPFHRILSLGAAYDWAISRELPQANALKQQLDELMVELAHFYGKRQKDRVYSLYRSGEYNSYD